MYILTILRNRCIVRVLEYHEPPDSTEIEKHLTGNETFDISRKPIDDEDIEQYLHGGEYEEI